MNPYCTNCYGEGWYLDNEGGCSDVDCCGHPWPHACLYCNADKHIPCPDGLYDEDE